MRRLLPLLPTLLLLCAACAAPSARASQQTRGRQVRVLLAQPQNAADIRASGPFTLVNLDGGKKFKIAKGGVFKISKSGKELRAGNIATAKGVRIELNNPADYFTLGGVQYRGPLSVTPLRAGINITEHIDLEDYLTGVLPYEMSPSWPLEALKAQAVAARTFTLKTIENTKNKDFDLYNDVRSQMYKGTVKTYDSVKKAVEGTKGETMLYKGKIFPAYYHSNCGGHTNGGSENIKPLNGAKCGYCKGAPNYEWQKTLPKEALNNYLKKNNIKGEIKKIKIGRKQAGGRAATLVLITSKEKKEVNCGALRAAIGPDNLRSCVITKISGLKLQGRGYGHGKGLCQEGAKAMALQGKSYKKILARYYPGAEIKKI
ncbi:MAG: SpoIID/LytB domain-containing protein [Elusimicrobiota bacterium]|nr:SpoIID/LytB domain-containing protein [Elusimicrobiota bacterium]